MSTMIMSRGNKSRKKFIARGPSRGVTPRGKIIPAEFIGNYTTKNEAEEAIHVFISTGDKMHSGSRQIRKRGTGSICKSGNIWAARYVKNKKKNSKTFATKELAEKWLKAELNL